MSRCVTAKQCLSQQWGLPLHEACKISVSGATQSTSHTDAYGSGNRTPPDFDALPQVHTNHSALLVCQTSSVSVSQSPLFCSAWLPYQTQRPLPAHLSCLGGMCWEWSLSVASSVSRVVQCCMTRGETRCDDRCALAGISADTDHRRHMGAVWGEHFWLSRPVVSSTVDTAPGQLQHLPQLSCSSWDLNTETLRDVSWCWPWLPLQNCHFFWATHTQTSTEAGTTPHPKSGAHNCTVLQHQGHWHRPNLMWNTSQRRAVAICILPAAPDAEPEMHTCTGSAQSHSVARYQVSLGVSTAHHTRPSSDCECIAAMQVAWQCALWQPLATATALWWVVLHTCSVKPIAPHGCDTEDCVWDKG